MPSDDDDEFTAQGNFDKQHKSHPLLVEGREVRMSDIAMLVAEEYERRVSLVRKANVDGVVGVSVSQERIEEAQRLMKMKMMPKAESLSLKWAWEPKSQVGVAASVSFFSA